MVNYLKGYLSQLTQVAEPLKDLPRNDMLWCWESKHQETFKAHQRRTNQDPGSGKFLPKGRLCHPSRWIHKRPGCSSITKG